MTTDSAARTEPDHVHSGFDLAAAEVGPSGEPVDVALLGRFTGAALDGCTSCQDTYLTVIVADASTTARFVELACVSTQRLLGGLPATMTDVDDPGLLESVQFRRLAAAGLDGERAAMWALSADMSETDRRAAANTAADVLVGQLLMLEGGG